MNKPCFYAARKDWTRVYECDEYKCYAHPNSCLFCQYCTDVWFDYTNGPYMFLCVKNNPTDKGMLGECNTFKE